MASLAGIFLFSCSVPVTSAFGSCYKLVGQTCFYEVQFDFSRQYFLLFGSHRFVFCWPELMLRCGFPFFVHVPDLLL
jgi:hypothetical protein